MAPQTCALGSRWLQERLPQHLWREDERPGELLAVRVVQVHAQAKQTTAVYHLTLRTPSEEVIEQSYVGYAAADGARLRKDYQTIAARAAVAPRAGRSVALLPEANLLLVACPNDPEMGALLSAEELKRWVEDHPGTGVLGVPGARRGRVEDARVILLRYMPAKRATSRCWIRYVDAGGTEQTASCIAKQFADKDKARRLYRNLLALARCWSGERRPEGGAAHFALRLPRALAFDRAKGLVLIEVARGRDVSTALGELDLETTIPAVGRLLARLHRMPAAVRRGVPKRVSRRSELEDTRVVLADVGRAFPRLRARARRLLERLSAAPLDVRTRTVVLHGSFRLNHVFIDDAALTLLDLDGLRTGEPAVDVATFLSSLYQTEAEGRLDPSLRPPLMRLFLRGYLGAVPWSLEPAGLSWFLANLLINKQARKYLRHDDADREAKLARMLALAEQALAIAAVPPAGVEVGELGTLIA
jgi:hypothetical protein